MAPVIHIVDDDATSRWLVEEMLQGIGADVRTYECSADFLAAYRPGPCECLVTDLRMPGMSGLELQQRLLDDGATLPIIFMSAYSEIAAAVAAVKQGAVDFLEKPIDAAVLRDKVQAALAASRQLHARRIERTGREALLALLTPREREIVELVSFGRSSRQIAEALSISVRTVETHRAKAMEKLQVGSALELARAFS